MPHLCFHPRKYTWLALLPSKQAKSTFIKSSSNNILLSHHLCTSCNAAASEQPEWIKDRFTLRLLSKGRESFERHTLVKLWHSFSKMMETELHRPCRSSNPSICSINFPLKVKLPPPQPWYMTTFSLLANVQRCSLPANDRSLSSWSSLVKRQVFYLLFTSSTPCDIT